MQAFSELFNRALARTLRHEGYFVLHPLDPGGATCYGITERVARAHGFTGQMRDIPMDLVREIYFKDYWRAVRGDDLVSALAPDVFDAAVNVGPKQAIKQLQRALAVNADGVIGPMTLAAMRAAEPQSLAGRFAGERLLYYAALSTWATFGKGWTRRVAANLREPA